MRNFVDILAHSTEILFKLLCDTGNKYHIIFPKSVCWHIGLTHAQNPKFGCICTCVSFCTVFTKIPTQNENSVQKFCGFQEK
eukprot:TRINITY_DN3705_c0_g1_i1.p2 TRINITY_DN3705_c0_g1~~TRINITY_DN3705_c0_g1_i1.p2  ORF type:complete len:82 (+),score=14.69 TRINITY_DN3705_c0_g1_i1:226-471(+)